VATPFTWLTKTAAIQALQGRLKVTAANPGLWTAAELWMLLTEGLRHFNGLTEQWNAPFNINNAQGQWINTGTLTGSPRLRSVTDQYLYGQMCSMLLEPQLNAGTWAGTNQFTFQNLQYCLQKRTQEVIQATSCNIALISPVNSTPGTRRSVLPDTVLEPRRIRFMALMAQTTGTALFGASQINVGAATGIAAGQIITGTGIQAGTFVTDITGLAVSISLPTPGALAGSAVQFWRPITLTREDALAFQSFEPEYLQTVGFPQSWAIASEPPLAFDVDIAPTTPGNFEVLALNAGPTFAPPAASLLGVPDDWALVPMYGALADVLGMESEATDRQRSAYCMERYTQMLEMMKGSNWLLQTLINGKVADATSLAEMDSLAVGWQQSQQNLPSVVEAGMDLIAPVPGSGQLVTLQLVGNAPLLDSTNTYVQCSRDDFEAILNYAQHAAMFKCGGGEFAATMPLLKDFYRAAVAVNKRWATYGVFVELLRAQGKKQDEAKPREAESNEPA
jgi:hypothetical protein